MCSKNPSRMSWTKFSGVHNVFGIADDISVAGFHELGRDHDATLDKMLRICRQTNLKLTKISVFFLQVHQHCLFGEVLSLHAVCPDPRKAQALTDMPLPQSWKELLSFLGILTT